MGCAPEEMVRRPGRLGPRLDGAEKDEQSRDERPPCHALLLASKIARGFFTSICSI
jgi:hypothetical protein